MCKQVYKNLENKMKVIKHYISKFAHCHGFVDALNELGISIKNTCKMHIMHTNRQSIEMKLIILKIFYSWPITHHTLENKLIVTIKCHDTQCMPSHNEKGICTQCDIPKSISIIYLKLLLSFWRCWWHWVLYEKLDNCLLMMENFKYFFFGGDI